MYPQFLDEEDGEFWGTAMRGNLIVSCSGVEPEFDEAIANMIIGIIFAIAMLAIFLHATKKTTAKKAA